MKKPISLLLAVIILCSVLTAFSVPAMAISQKSVESDEEITGNESYDTVIIDPDIKLTVKSGASLSTTRIMSQGTLVIEPGATVIVKTRINSFGGSNIEVGGKLQSKDSQKAITFNITDGNLTMKEGGTIDMAITHDSYPGISDKLKPYCYVINGDHLTVAYSHNSVDGACTVCGKNVCEAKGIAHTFKNGKCTTCGRACQNDFHKDKCPICGMTASTLGSVFSGGSLAVIVGIAAAVIFGAGGFLLGRRKKKPVAVNTAAEENFNEEE